MKKIIATLLSLCPAKPLRRNVPPAAAVYQVRLHGEERQNELFPDNKLKKMILPLFLEQLLVMFVGLAEEPLLSASISENRIRNRQEDGCCRYCFCDGVRLGNPGGSFCLEGEDRNVERFQVI